MNWALKEAKKLIKKYPDKDEFVIASGVSPSGFIHIGNFREIVTTYFVGKELENLGKKVKFILSFDDFDRFRKVPNGIPTEYNKYIGMPYSSIPSPFSKNKTYAEEMEERFVEELNRMGIYPITISQTKEYKSGRYNDKIKLSLEKRKEIFDILSKYKTQELNEDDRNNYYPISLYCDECGKDSTIIINYDDYTGEITYECACGHKHTQNIKNSKNIKLQWKIDWPMRWQEEGVIFEPGGRDHSASNGSFVASKDIAKEIFNYEAPSYVAYDFIGIKGTNGKMASSTGNVLTLTDLLEVYDKHIILWFYAKNKPNHQFNIALDEDVLRFYSEFDRTVKGYLSGKLSEKNTSILSLTDVGENYSKYPDFATIANFLPMVNYNVDKLSNLLKKENIDTNSIYFQDRLLKSNIWLKKYNNSKINILEDFNIEYFENLTDEEKEWMKKTIDILDNEYENLEEFQALLYSVVKTGSDDPKELKKRHKRYFQIIYNLILGQDKGPKMSLLLSALDKELLQAKLYQSDNDMFKLQRKK